MTVTIQYRRIAVEAETAEQVVTFLTDLFRQSDPSEALGNDSDLLLGNGGNLRYFGEGYIVKRRRDIL